MQIGVFVFSFNRAEFLQNCVASIEHAFPWAPLHIMDDASSDEAVKRLLSSYRERGSVHVHVNAEKYTARLGGLYHNMQRAMEIARASGYKYALFIQDDMQVVRDVSVDEFIQFDRVFSDCEKLIMLYCCFLKGQNSSRDKRTLEFEEGSRTYRLKDSLAHADVGIVVAHADVGIFAVERWWRHIGSFQRTEALNNQVNAEKGFEMRAAAFPFMMYLPYPYAYRYKGKGVLMSMGERLAKVGFYPWSKMTEAQKDEVRARAGDVDSIIGENALINPGLRGRPKPWLYGAVTGPRRLVKSGFLRRLRSRFTLLRRSIIPKGH